MTTWLVAMAAPDLAPIHGSDFSTAARSLVAVLVVLGLVVLLAWLLRRGAFGSLGRRGPSAILVETACPLGERRSLMIVAVEGRRFLLGLTPQQVSLVADLGGPSRAFADSLSKASSSEVGGLS